MARFADDEFTMKPFIHPRTPPKLKAAFRQVEYKYHDLVSKLKVNPRYLYDLIANGIEPNDTTKKLQEVRIKMFLPRRKRKKATNPKTPVVVPNHIYWWRRLPKETRNDIIRQAWVQLSYLQERATQLS